MHAPTLNVVAVKQRKDYDCGLACAAMVLLTLARRYGVTGITADGVFEGYMRESQGNTSIWTIDVLMLLKRHLRAMGIAHHVDVRFTTTTLGCNPDYAENPFYVADFTDDEQRVTGMFKQAAAEGYTVECKALSRSDVTATLAASASLLIVLVDVTILMKPPRATIGGQPSQAESLLTSVASSIAQIFTPCLGGTCTRMLARSQGASMLPASTNASFQGHYVVASAYDASTRTVTVHNPIQLTPQVVDIEVFDAARTAFGTDNDVVSVTIRE